MNSKIKALIIYGTMVALSCQKLKLIHDSNLNLVKIYDESYNDDFNVVAHRGFSSLVVENSRKAIEMCDDYNFIDGIEIDVSMTKDKKLVILHTNQYGDNYNLDKPIYEYTLAELRQKSFKANQEKDIKRSLLLFNNDPMNQIISTRTYKLIQEKAAIITLDELLEKLDIEKPLLIDIKFNKDPDIMIEQILSKLSKINCTNIVIQSLNYDYLSRMKSIKPTLTYQLAITNSNQLKYLNTDFNQFAIRYSLINKEMIGKLISDGKKVAVWTINNGHKLNEVIKKTGDYADDLTYITDYPDCISAILNKNVKVKK